MSSLYQDKKIKAKKLKNKYKMLSLCQEKLS